MSLNVAVKVLLLPVHRKQLERGMLCSWITSRAQIVHLCRSDSQMLCLKHAN